MEQSRMINRFTGRLLAILLAFAVHPQVAFASTPVELEVDLLEVHLGKGDDHLLLDSALTLGDGADQFVLELAGGSDTRTAFDDFELVGLYSRTLSDTAALRLGLRHDLREGSDLTHATAGLVLEPLPGLELESMAFLSQDGDLTGAAELIFGLDLAPQLTLEPRLAIGWSARTIPEEDLGNGLTDIEASVRLRRSLGDNFNVYTGIIHERLVGSTRSIAVAAGDPSRVTRAIVGVGFGF
jgi:copper resistance protein B